MKTQDSKTSADTSIHVGVDAREGLLEIVERLAPDRVFIITDRTVEALHSEEIQKHLPYSTQAELIVFNEGEENKNLATLQHVAADLVEAGATDRSLVLNLGGDVVLNVGALAACLLGRGIRFAHMPTSVAAQWSTVSNPRHALNFVGGRNMMGLRRPAEFSIVDPWFLETVEPRDARASLVEFARMGLVRGGKTCDRVREILSASGFDRMPTLGNTVASALALTRSAIRADSHVRLATSIEAYGAELAAAMLRLAEGRLNWGETLFFGIAIVSEIGVVTGLTNPEDHKAHDDLLGLVRPAMAFPAHARTDRLVYLLHGNNKTDTSPVELMILEKIGLAGGRPSAEASIMGEPVPVCFVQDDAITEAIERVRRRDDA